MTMAATRIATRIIDGDGHVMEDIERIEEFLPPPYKGKRFFPRVAFFPPLDHMRHPHETLPGSFPQVGPEGWLAFLDDVGIETTVLYPTWGLTYGRVTNADWAIALTRAYNDWLCEAYLKRHSRFRGMGLIPMLSDYILRHIKAGRIFVGCEGNEPALAYAVRVVGPEPFLYSSDFPHEVNNAMCKEEIGEILGNEALTPAEKEAILYRNAERFYRLDAK
jgi:predicted TIM-barrel fold metal-dependent hydrolase